MNYSGTDSPLVREVHHAEICDPEGEIGLGYAMLLASVIEPLTSAIDAVSLRFLHRRSPRRQASTP